MAFSDGSSSSDMHSNKLILRVSANGVKEAMRHFQDGEVSYEGCDTYRFEANAQGEPFAMTFLSRSAMAEFLEGMYLLVLRDSRPSQIA
jgi:hypothetical protein